MFKIFVREKMEQGMARSPSLLFWTSVCLRSVLLQGAITYRIPAKRMTWSVLFKHIEANKERLGITDYAVSQTTLEQVGGS